MYDVDAALKRHDVRNEDGFTAQVLRRMTRQHSALWRRYQAGEVRLCDLPFSQRTVMLTLAHYAGPPEPDSRRTAKRRPPMRTRRDPLYG
ncbi:MAG: hypothetical protein GX601_05635 [Anaerolineales bacterium]|nr:hypothetical protein [Anaerolineales bacterium]